MLSAFFVVFLVAGAQFPNTKVVIADSLESASEEILSSEFAEVLAVQWIALADEWEGAGVLDSAQIAAERDFRDSVEDDLRYIYFGGD